MNRKTAIYFFAAVLAAALVVVFFALNRNTRSGISIDEAPSFRLSASELIEAFITDEAAADSIYGGKVVEVDGRVDRIITREGARIWLLGDSTNPVRVSCYLEPPYQDEVISAEAGAKVRVKGVCNGMLGDIVLDKTVVMLND